jgi:hypothetical protein
MKSRTASKILITSPPDRDSVVAEVYFDNAQFAELRVDGSSITCEIYSRRDGKPWELDCCELREALSKAERKLACPENK